jgi:hypothetical protein
MQHRQVRKQFFGIWSIDEVFLSVPTGSFKVDTIDKAAIFRLFFYLMISHMIHDLNLKVDSIDSNNVFSCVILESSGNECLREEEAGDPEDIGRSSVDPLLEKLNSLC